MTLMGERLPLSALPRSTIASDYLCAYCWPALNRATHWTDAGLACCARCACDSERRCQLPRWSLVGLSQ